MGVVVNIDQAPIDQQSDIANTVGATLLTDLGVAGVTLAAAGASRIAAQGRMPYDPADPNFSGQVKIRNASVSVGGGVMNGSGLLIILVLWLIFRKKGSAPS